MQHCRGIKEEQRKKGGPGRSRISTTRVSAGWLKLKNSMPHPFGNRSSCSFLSHVALLPWVSLLCAWLFNQKLRGWVEGRSDVILSRRKRVQHCCLQPVLVFFVIFVFRLTASFEVELPQSAPQPDLSKKATPHA